MARIVVGIAGNIGAGKSTLGRFIAGESGQKILAEYVPGHNLRYLHEKVDEAALELLYRDLDEYSDDFEIIQAQLRVLRHRLASLHEGVVLLDRTLIEGSETFRRKAFQDSRLTHNANEVYDRVVRAAIDRLGRNSHKQKRWLERLVVYLRASDPLLLHKRQIQRGDPLEKIIPVDYLTSLNAMYEKFIASIIPAYEQWGLFAPHVLVLDGALDMNADSSLLENHTRAIGKKLKEMEG